jgi:hypothetical protein
MARLGTLFADASAGELVLVDDGSADGIWEVG